GVDDDSLDKLVELEERAQDVVLEGLEFVEQGGLAVVASVGEVLEEQLDLLAGDDVADVLRAPEMREGEPDHLVARHGGSAAVAGIDGGVELDPQPAHERRGTGEIDERAAAPGGREG